MTWLKIVVGILIYHLVIGTSFVLLYSDVNPDIHGVKAYASVIMGWPLYAAATVEMDHRWTDTMTNVEETLREINSGRWEHKGDKHE
jgi:hypothetical protein